MAGQFRTNQTKVEACMVCCRSCTRLLGSMIVRDRPDEVYVSCLHDKTVDFVSDQ